MRRSDADALCAACDGTDWRGVLRIYPDDTIEVIAYDRLVDLVEQQFDNAIRIYPSPDSALVGRRFAEDQLVAMTAP
jgi:DNA-binding transcriptional LysR family regulator